MCDDGMLDKIGDKIILPLGKTGEEIASNLYLRLLQGEKLADVIIAFEGETGTDLDVGIMNRLTKACKPYDGKFNLDEI